MHRTMPALLIVAMLAAHALAQSEVQTESAAMLMWQTQEEHGFEAALAKLHEMIDDPAVEYRFNDRGFYGLTVSRMLWRGRRDDARATLEIVADVLPESPLVWSALGSTYIHCGHKQLALRCLKHALELDPSQTHLQWLTRHIDTAFHAARLGYVGQERYEPGAATGLTGPYLGQQPPGTIPQPFAPGLVGTCANEFSITFSPDGKEIYFSRAWVGVLVSRRMEDGWTVPELIRFYPEGDSDEPNVSPDGRFMLFNHRDFSAGRRDRILHIAERADNGWGAPRELFPGMYATLARSGTLYYTETSGRPDIGVIVSRAPTAEGFAEPVVLGGGVNSDYPDAHPYIDPDERFIIFDSTRGGDPMAVSLYICFRNADGTWGEAINLHDHLNLPRFIGQPTLSPDGKYLFYSYLGDLWWVSAERLRALRPVESVGD